MTKIRYPSHAGAFYAGNPESLRRQIEDCFLHDLGPGTIPETEYSGPRQILGLICPHAGYPFSGPVAAHAYHKMASDGKPDVVVILAPNHTGRGSALAAMNEGVWRTPLGDVEIDGESADLIVKKSRIVDIDDTAHRNEHSIEVQIPFLQYLYNSDFEIVPICFSMQDLSTSREVGEAIAQVLEDKNGLIIASSDMTHYEPQKEAKRKDEMLLDSVKAMDESRMYSTIQSHRITACGYGPIAALITAAKRSQATGVNLLSYQTSGDVTGDYSSVVGYASMCFKKK
ncbi:MAG: AmmeMemoRadiSam system protein B [Thermoproteota archaeon]